MDFEAEIGKCEAQISQMTQLMLQQKKPLGQVQGKGQMLLGLLDPPWLQELEAWVGENSSELTPGAHVSICRQVENTRWTPLVIAETTGA